MTLAALRAAHNRQASPLRGRYDLNTHWSLDVYHFGGAVVSSPCTPEKRKKGMQRQRF